MTSSPARPTRRTADPRRDLWRRAAIGLALVVGIATSPFWAARFWAWFVDIYTRTAQLPH